MSGAPNPLIVAVPQTPAELRAAAQLQDKIKAGYEANIKSNKRAPILAAQAATRAALYRDKANEMEKGPQI